MSQHHRLSTIALVLLVAMGACAATAGAAPLSMTFTDSSANVGLQLDDDALFEAPDTAPFEAEIDSATGAISAGVLTVPQFSTFITDPIDADVAVDFEIGVIDGSFDQATGALTLQGTAGGTLTANGKECTVSTTPSTLALSTAGNNGGTSPRSGGLFSAGLAGAGAIAGQWTDMHAAPVDTEPGGDTLFCEDVEEEIGGPGGVWLEQAGEPVKPGPEQPAKPATSSGGGNADPTPPTLAPACVVPKLAGKTPARAKAALRAVGCKLGKVHRPKPRKGQAQRALVVKASTPAAGASPANGKVHLRLGPKSQ